MSLLLLFSGVASLDVAFSGTATITFGQTGALAAGSKHSGTTAITFSHSTAFKAGVAGVGTSTIVFGHSAALTLGSASSGTTTIIFSQTGDFVAGAIANFVGTIPIVFSQTGVFVAGVVSDIWINPDGLIVVFGRREGMPSLFREVEWDKPGKLFYGRPNKDRHRA